MTGTPYSTSTYIVTYDAHEGDYPGVNAYDVHNRNDEVQAILHTIYVQECGPQDQPTYVFICIPSRAILTVYSDMYKFSYLWALGLPLGEGGWCF